MAASERFFQAIIRFFDTVLFSVGNAPITLSGLIRFAFFVLLLLYVAGRLRAWLVKRLLTASGLDEHTREILGAATIVVGL